jgi:heptaprenyl diphosphate synthase
LNKSKAIAFTGICTALALILAYIEILIPPIFPAVPGIKMGLPNIIIVFLLYRRGPVSAIVVSLLRTVLVTILFGNGMAFMYSLAGSVLSMIIMILLQKLNFLSTVGVSVAGAIAHNLGQTLMAMVLLDTSEIAYYMVVLTVAGTIAGVFIGICGSLLIKRVPKRF